MPVDLPLRGKPTSLDSLLPRALAFLAAVIGAVVLILLLPAPEAHDAGDMSYVLTPR